MRQLGLFWKDSRGGRREGAGRKPIVGNRDVPHVTRQWAKGEPLHVTMRTMCGVGRLRKPKIHSAIAKAMGKAKQRDGFRIVHLSIQHDHLHLIVEADSKELLSRGMQGFAVSAAKWINRALRRTGTVFAHRFFSRVVDGPRLARNTLAYVLNNWRHHREDRRSSWVLDPFSTAISFDGWKQRIGPPSTPRYERLPASSPRTWTLRCGWRLHHPPIDAYEVPAE